MNVIEGFLVGLDRWPWGAICRVVLGFCIPPIFRMVGNPDRVWMAPIFFIVLLIALREIPAVLRRALPFSPEAKNIWAERRNTAKTNDSYQWQKLFWIGLGLLSYSFIGDGLRNGEWVLTCICLVGGGAGLLFWYRINAARSAKPDRTSVSRV
jgi:hypothetical protein